MDFLLIFLVILTAGIALPILGGLARGLIVLISMLDEWLEEREIYNEKRYGESVWRAWFLYSAYGIAVCILFYLFTCVVGNQCSSY